MADVSSDVSSRYVAYQLRCYRLAYNAITAHNDVKANAHVMRARYHMLFVKETCGIEYANALNRVVLAIRKREVPPIPRVRRETSVQD